MKKILIVFSAILVSASLSAQNKIEVGLNYSPENYLYSTDVPNMIFKVGAYGEYRWILGKHFEAGARLDAKVGPIGPYLVNDNALAISGDLLAVADLNLFPGKTVNPFIGFGLGPGFGMHNNTFDHLWFGQFLIYPDIRLGIELFNHLRLAVNYSMPYWGGSFEEMYTTLNANIGWVF